MSKNKKRFKLIDRRKNTMFNFDFTKDTIIKPIDKDDDWGNTNEDLKIVNTCGRIPEGPVTIVLSRVVKNKIDLLMKKYENCEWLAYLIGEPGTRYAKDLFLPVQEVSTASVHVVGDKPAGTIGVIHSHHSMGAFFSGTDDTYINQNNDISIVVAHNGIKSQVRWETPCGHKVVREGTVIVEKENLFNEVEFINQVNAVVNDKFERIVPDFMKPNVPERQYKTNTGNVEIPDILKGQNHKSIPKYIRGSELVDKEDEENLNDALSDTFGLDYKM